MDTTIEIAQLADISGYLSYAGISKKNIFMGGSLDNRLPVKIQMENAALKFMNIQDLTYPSIRKVANWVYELCGAFNPRARAISTSGSGVIIINPNTGQVLNGIIIVDRQFVVGQPDSLLAVGGTTFIITDSRIVVPSFSMYEDTGRLPQQLVDRISYSVIYSTTTIQVTLNTPVENGQCIIYSYQKGLASSTGVGKVTQPTLYHTFTTNQSSYQFTQLIGVAIIDLTTVMRNTTGVQPFASVVTDSNQIQFDSATGTFYPPTGDIFTPTNTLYVAWVN